MQKQCVYCEVGTESFITAVVQMNSILKGWNWKLNTSFVCSTSIPWRHEKVEVQPHILHLCTREECGVSFLTLSLNYRGADFLPMVQGSLWTAQPFWKMWSREMCQLNLGSKSSSWIIYSIAKLYTELANQIYRNTLI